MPYKDPEKQRLAKHQSYLRRKDKQLEYIRNKRASLRLSINKIKLERGCDRCGYNDHAVALDYHHVDDQTKDLCISWAIRDRWAWERILKEIDKCELICANCHRVETHK